MWRWESHRRWTLHRRRSFGDGDGRKRPKDNVHLLSGAIDQTIVSAEWRDSAVMMVARVGIVVKTDPNAYVRPEV